MGESRMNSFPDFSSCVKIANKKRLGSTGMQNLQCSAFVQHNSTEHKAALIASKLNQALVSWVEKLEVTNSDFCYIPTQSDWYKKKLHKASTNQSCYFKKQMVD